MKIQQSASLQENGQWSALAARKDRLLENELDLPTAEGTWELTQDYYKNPFLRLHVRDPLHGRSTCDFSPGELANDTIVTTRLHQLKDALVRVGKWRQELERFYAQVRQWLTKFPHPIEYTEDSITLNEVASGLYDVPRLIVETDGYKMRVEPTAIWVMGADGEVQLKGIGSMILRYFENGGWYYLPIQIPYTLHELTEELFLDVAEECLYGG